MFEASKGVHAGYEIIALEGAGQKVCILPENGLNLYSWTVDGREIMMEPGDFSLFGTKYGTPLLFPMPNRVKDSVYRWEGRDYVLQKRGVKIARHGLVCDEPFTVTAMGAEDDKAYVTAEIEIAPGNALYEGYPFACLLCVTYTRTENGVRMDAHIENRGEQTMPFGFAAHPYFTKRGDASRCFIKAPLHRYYETDENLIPTGRILPATGDMAVCGDYHSVESLNLDTVFRGMTADLSAHIRWEDLEDGAVYSMPVLIDNEATLKRVKLYEDHITLEPENPMYKPLSYWGEEMNEVRILGKAVAFTSTIR